MIEAAIKSRLAATAAVTAIVSDRIRPVVAAQYEDAVAHVTYQVTAVENLDCLDGEATHRNESFQVDCYAPTFAACKALADAVQDALHYYQGTSGGIAVDVILHEGTTDLTPPADAGMEKPLYRLSLEFRSLVHS